MPKYDKIKHISNINGKGKNGYNMKKERGIIVHDRTQKSTTL